MDSNSFFYFFLLIFFAPHIASSFIIRARKSSDSRDSRTGSWSQEVGILFIYFFCNQEGLSLSRHSMTSTSLMWTRKDKSPLSWPAGSPIHVGWWPACRMARTTCRFCVTDHGFNVHKLIIYFLKNKNIQMIILLKKLCWFKWLNQ